MKMATAPIKIQKLDALLKNYLGDEKTIIDHETSRLTAIGENYGSLMLALKIHLKTLNQEEIIEAVAKIPPPGEFIQKMFNIPITFRNEIDFYRTIIPALEDFLKEQGVEDDLDCFPKFLGGRLNLQNGKQEVDADAVLVLENLKSLGYEMIDRNIGFDFETSKVILKALAKFHAGSIALKTFKPEMFEEKIKPLFYPYKIFDLGPKMMDLVVEKNKAIVESAGSCEQDVQKVVNALKATPPFLKNDPTFVREPFATLIHTDAWINNFMVKFENGQPSSCKIVDFQLAEYSSLARDVIFFVYSSVQISVLREHYEDLIQFYYNSLISSLKKFGCEKDPFTFDELEEEIRLVNKEGAFLQIMIMLEPIFASKENVKELDEYNAEDMTDIKPVPPKHKERAKFIVDEFVRKNWI